MNQQDAQMWADVAKRIGLNGVHVALWNKATNAWHVLYTVPEWEGTGDGTHVFNPPDNPADERMLWDWLEARTPMEIDLSRWETNGEWYVSVEEMVGCKSDPCRVTALGRAIAGLPE